MGKAWFMTKNDRIIDLNNFVEFNRKGKTVYAFYPSGSSTNLGDFETEEDAKEFIMDIFCCLEDEDEN